MRKENLFMGLAQKIGLVTVFLGVFLFNSSLLMAEEKEPPITKIEQKTILLPPATYFKRGDRKVRLKSPILLIKGEDASEREDYAFESLTKELKRIYELSSEIVDAESLSNYKNPGTKFIIGTISSNPLLKGKVAETLTQKLESDEGFLIAANSPSTILLLGKGDSGVIYGSFAILNMLEKTKEEILFPYVELVSNPKIKIRASISQFYTYRKDKKQRTINMYDWFARWGINTSYSRYGLKVPPDFKNFYLPEAHKRGISIYGAFGPYKHKLNPCNSEDLEVMIKYYQDCLEAGADGLVLLLDDTPTECFNEECKDRFKTVRGEHLFWVEKFIQFCEANEVKNIYICPAVYWSATYGMYGGGDEYLSGLGNISLPRTHVWYCRLDKSFIDKFHQELGIENYAWWYNGMYPFFHCAVTPDIGWGKHWSWGWNFWGFPALHWGLQVPYDRSGVAGFGRKANPKAKSMFSTLHERIQSAWLCTGNANKYPSRYVIALWGSYLWSPAEYKWEDSEASS